MTDRPKTADTSAGELEVRSDVRYSQAHDLGLDVYRSTASANGAALIDIHGGGWFRGDKAKDADWAGGLARAGYLVVVPNYREAPSSHYPAPLEDMEAVWDWLRGSDYAFDRNRIGTIGSSAGGNMSVEMGLRYGIPAVSLSGILDIADWMAAHPDTVPAPDESQDFAGASAGINQGGRNDPFYKWFLLNYFTGEETTGPLTEDVTDLLREGTPTTRVTRDAGPMYLANSLTEFVPNSGVIALSASLADAGVPHTTRFLPGSRHAKGYLAEVADEVTAFLARTLLDDDTSPSVDTGPSAGPSPSGPTDGPR